MRWAPSEPQRLYALTLVIGLACGLAAVAFHLAIDVIGRELVDRSMAAPGHSWVIWTIVTPTLGATVCGLLMMFVVPNARGSGIPQVKIAFATKDSRIRMRDAVGKFFVSALQIGSGSSLGREGPTALICSGIASTLGRFARVSPKSLRRLLPVGTAAGIAAAFNAPIAAVTFTIEEVVGKLDNAMLSGVIISAALSAVIERSVLGPHPMFTVPETYALAHSSSLLVYGALGIGAGVVSILFTDSLLALRAHFQASRMPAWSQPAVGGAVTGALAVVGWMMLSSKGMTGGGYATLGLALAGGLPAKVMIVLCVMKIIATVASYASGGSGGLFAPALFIGGMLGGAFGTLDGYVFPSHLGEPIGAFALVGMGAVFSGVIRAPMTSVLIIIEMTGAYSLILPLMIANMTAYGIARARRPLPIYTALLAQDGVNLGDGGAIDAIEDMLLGQLVRGDAVVRTFRSATSGVDMLAARGAGRPQDVYPVLDAAGRLVGIVRADELGTLESEPDALSVVNASDLVHTVPAMTVDDDLRSALDAMLANGVAQLPVTDRQGKVVALVSETEIARAYLDARHGRARSATPHAMK